MIVTPCTATSVSIHSAAQARSVSLDKSDSGQNASAASGQRGYRHYRLAASGPADRDGLLELLDVRLELAGGSRFRNDERIVQLYDLLLSHQERVLQNNQTLQA